MVCAEQAGEWEKGAKQFHSLVICELCASCSSISHLSPLPHPSCFHLFHSFPILSGFFLPYHLQSFRYCRLQCLLIPSHFIFQWPKLHCSVCACETVFKKFSAHISAVAFRRAAASFSLLPCSRVVAARSISTVLPASRAPVAPLPSLFQSTRRFCSNMTEKVYCNTGFIDFLWLLTGESYKNNDCRRIESCGWTARWPDWRLVFVWLLIDPHSWDSIIFCKLGPWSFGDFLFTIPGHAKVTMRIRVAQVHYDSSNY